MDRQRPKGILIISGILFLFPLILSVLIGLTFWGSLGKLDTSFFKPNLDYLWGFVLYGLVGFGVFKLNNIARWVAIFLLANTTFTGPVSVLTMDVLIDKNFLMALIEKEGFSFFIIPCLHCFQC